MIFLRGGFARCPRVSLTLPLSHPALRPPGQQRRDVRGGRAAGGGRRHLPVWGTAPMFKSPNILIADLLMPNDVNIISAVSRCRRARVDSERTSPRSPTSWPPEITCSSRPPSRSTSRWVHGRLRRYDKSVLLHPPRDGLPWRFKTTRTSSIMGLGGSGKWNVVL